MVSHLHKVVRAFHSIERCHQNRKFKTENRIRNKTALSLCRILFHRIEFPISKKNRIEGSRIPEVGIWILDPPQVCTYTICTYSSVRTCLERTNGTCVLTFLPLLPLLRCGEKIKILWPSLALFPSCLLVDISLTVSAD